MMPLLKQLIQWMRRLRAPDARSSRPDPAPVSIGLSANVASGAVLPVGDTMALAAPGVSPLLYIAGLIVTLSGIYAVNYGLDDTAFALQSYGLVCLGYAFSYFLRVRGISLQSIQIPLSVCIILALLAGISGNGTGWMVPSGVENNNLISIQIAIAWIAIIHTFLMASDAAVLFAFVPASSMLALVSTMNSDPRIQDAFLVLIGAGTFLTIHEMYMRTRQITSTQIRGSGESRMYGWQILITVVCLAGALLLANLVALPIRTIGQAIFDPATNPGLNNTIVRPKNAAVSNVQVSESSVLNLATGPTPEMDTPLMKVQAPVGQYWRGSTFRSYTGHTFINDDNDMRENWEPEKEANPDTSPGLRRFASPDSPVFNSGMRTYKMPRLRCEIPDTDMRDSSTVLQHITLLGGNFSSLYGAGAIQRVSCTLSGLVLNRTTGAISAQVPPGLIYDVASQVPCGDVGLLRRYTQDGQDGKRSSEGIDVPKTIRDAYLPLPPVTEETAPVQQLALACIAGKQNDYDRAEAIRAYIAAHCKYNLQAAAAPRDHDVVAWFLLNSQEGYCDSFAAAAVVMCRYAGMPTRLASGFLAGDFDGEESYTVRLKHKHVWAEVFFPHIGWVPFDATEGSVDISDHAASSRRRITSFAAWLTSHGILPPLMCAVLLCCLLYVLKTEVLDRYRLKRGGEIEKSRRSGTNQAIVDAYLQVSHLLERAGLARPPHQTPKEYLVSVSASTGQLLPGLAEPLGQLTRLHGIYRYSIREASDAEVAEARAAVEAIRLQLKQVSRKEIASDRKSDSKGPVSSESTALA